MINSLEEAIKHCEEVADTCEFEASKYDMTDAYESHVACQEGECAAEHRQLAEWLRKLEKYEEGIDQIKELINNYKGCDMWDTANGLQFALECLEVDADDSN